MSDELPQGWATARISDVTERVPNIKPEDSPDKEFGYVDISSIDNSSFVITDAKRLKGKDAPWRARRPIRPNDILFSNVRTYLRNIALVDQDCAAQVCSTGFTVLRPNSRVEPRFLFRYVLTRRFLDRVTPQQTGTHYPATSDKVVMSEEIPLAPVAEQRRIVAKLETLLGKVDASQQRLAKIPVLLKRFRQSVLAAACSGRLTANWREEKREIESAGAFVRRVQVERKTAYESACAATVAKGERNQSSPRTNLLL
jgi:type I restriction enzyme, S subunit